MDLRVKKLIIILMGLTILCSMPMNVYAQESASSAETEMTEEAEAEESEQIQGSFDAAKNGIVQVNTLFVDQDGNSHILLSGTGFIIGDAEKNQYVITSNHIVNVPQDYKEGAFAFFEIPNENDEWSRLQVYTQVVVEGDVVVDATCLNSSNELDIAVLKLAQPIFTRTPLTILTSADYDVNALPYKVGDPVYALGYPGSNVYYAEPVFYSDAQIGITVGSIVNLVNTNGFQTIEHSSPIGSNNCGGPLVTGDGYVIGVNTLATDGVYYVSVDSTKITKILDGLGVEYNKEVLNPADEIIEEEPVIEPETKVSILPVLMACIGFVLIAAGGIAAIVIFVTKIDKDTATEKKTNKKDKKQEPNSSAINQYLETPVSKQPVMNQINCTNQGTSSETMVLGGSHGTNETCILNMEKTPSGELKLGTLIRRKSGEQIPLNKSNFTIGKDSLHVDYCVNDNGTISRQHVIIKADPKGVILEDCHSTNGTYLNGTKLASGQSVILRAGDSVRLANEEFEYQAK